MPRIVPKEKLGRHTWRPQGGVCVRCKLPLRKADEICGLTRDGSRMMCHACGLATGQCVHGSVDVFHDAANHESCPGCPDDVTSLEELAAQRQQEDEDYAFQRWDRRILEQAFQVDPEFGFSGRQRRVKA